MPLTELSRIRCWLLALEWVSEEKWLRSFLPGLARMLSNCDTRRIVPARDRRGSVRVKRHCRRASLRWAGEGSHALQGLLMHPARWGRSGRGGQVSGAVFTYMSALAGWLLARDGM